MNRLSGIYKRGIDVFNKKVATLEEKKRKIKWYKLRRKYIYGKLKKKYLEIIDKFYDLYLFELAQQDLLQMDNKMQSKIEKIKSMRNKLSYVTEKRENLKWYQLNKKRIYQKVQKRYASEIQQYVKSYLYEKFDK